jgi:hypothetical protein
MGEPMMPSPIQATLGSAVGMGRPFVVGGGEGVGGAVRLGWWLVAGGWWLVAGG